MVVMVQPTEKMITTKATARTPSLIPSFLYLKKAYTHAAKWRTNMAASIIAGAVEKGGCHTTEIAASEADFVISKTKSQCLAGRHSTRR
jgi:hypothetical protein